MSSLFFQTCNFINLLRASFLYLCGAFDFIQLCNEFQSSLNCLQVFFSDLALNNMCGERIIGYYVLSNNIIFIACKLDDNLLIGNLRQII